DVLGEPASVIGDVGELGFEPRQSFGDRLEPWIEARDPVRLVQGDRRRVARSRALAGQGLAQCFSSPGDRLAVLRRGQTRPDLVRLTGPKIRIRDLARLVLEQVDTSRDLPMVHASAIEDRPVLAPPFDRRSHSGSKLTMPTEAIKQVALPSFVQQPALIVLSVGLDQRTE